MFHSKLLYVVYFKPTLPVGFRYLQKIPGRRLSQDLEISGASKYIVFSPPILAAILNRKRLRLENDMVWTYLNRPYFQNWLHQLKYFSMSVIPLKISISLLTVLKLVGKYNTWPHSDEHAHLYTPTWRDPGLFK